MRRISTAELREKEVVNVCTGEILGYPCEDEINADDGRILSMIIPTGSCIPFFGKKQEYVIPWNMIECIGEDAILVKIPPSELCKFETHRKIK